MSSTAPDTDAIKALHCEFIQKLFESDLGIPVKEITTLPRCNNNFVHFVTFPSSLASDVAISSKPGTSPISAGTTKVVFRIGNPVSMFNHTVKVENTVATMQLMRQTLSKLAIVPHVYAWSKTGGPSDNGWILEQHMPGIDIEPDFHKNLSRESQRHVLGQIAEVLKTVQDFKLPATASGFGGLAFDADGNVVSGPFVVEPYTGPYPDMKSFYKDMLRAQLKEADRSRVAKGWRENGLRDRLDAFAERGLEILLSKTLAKDVEPSLIIGDVGMFLLP
jgi:hypothetical protein